MKKFLVCALMLCAAAHAEEEKAPWTDSSDQISTRSSGEKSYQDDNSNQISARASEDKSYQDDSSNQMCPMSSDDKSTKGDNPDRLCARNCKENLFKVGGAYSYLWLQPNGQSTLGGSLGGAQISYEYIKDNFFYGGSLFTYKQGRVSHGAVKRDILDCNLVERLGYTYSQCWWTCQLFSGFGFRYLGHDLKQTGLTTLKFQYKEFYIPVGFLLTGRATDYMTVGLDFSWMPQVYPAVQINPIGGANWIIKYRVDNLIVELPVTFNSPKYPNYLLEFRPFFEYWHDGATTAETLQGAVLGIPSNQYLFLGFQLNFGLLF